MSAICYLNTLPITSCTLPVLDYPIITITALSGRGPGDGRWTADTRRDIATLRLTKLIRHLQA